MKKPGGSLQQQLAGVDNLLEAHKNAEAIAVLSHLIEENPGDPELLYRGAHTAFMMEVLNLAHQWLQQLVKLPLPKLERGHEIVTLTQDCGLPFLADYFLARLRKGHPHELDLKLESADIAVANGDMDKAKQFYLEVLEHDPKCASALLYLAGDKTEDPESILALALAVGRKGLDSHQCSVLQRTAARCHDRLGQHDRAFAAYDEANRLHRLQRQDFGIERKLRSAPGFLAEFGKEQIDQLVGQGHNSRVPVFIVGMPRSGTTLLAQIIASHPQADSIGERRIVGNLISRRVRAAGVDKPLVEALAGDGSGLQVIGNEYLDLSGKLLSWKPDRCVDKMPFNFALVGPTHLIFPGSTIIHARRDPFDICWSMFCAGFRSPYLRLTLTEIGQLCALQEYVMDIWKQRFPQSIFESSYEQMIKSFDDQARAVINSIGLEWNESCGEFHRHKSQVRTASAKQVRRPIYTSSIGRSGPYRRWMGDFESARKATLSSLRSAK